MDLKSEMVDVADYHEAVELFFKEKWTDGLPVVPPTREKVEGLLRYAGRDPQEQVGVIGPKGGIATVEMLAINSVMGGCLPQHFPVVLAAVEAMLEPEHNLTGHQTTTHGNEPLVIVNGPIVKELDMATTFAVFGGGGKRANGVIGRAVRLILWNLGGCVPGEVDRTNFSHPGRWAFCIGEDEDNSPWEPLSVERGLARGVNAVTVFSCEANHSVHYGVNSAVAIEHLISAMTNHGTNNRYHLGQMLLAMTATNARRLDSEGWSKSRLKKHLWESTRTPLKELRGASIISIEDSPWPSWIDKKDDNFMVPLTNRWEDLHVVVCGGGQYFNMMCPGWGTFGGFAVTKEIKVPKQART